MSSLVDHRGRPIQTKQLKSEQATVGINGVRQPFRELTFPASPSDLAAILSAAANGQGHDYLQIAVELETRDLQYGAALGQRKESLLSMDWGFRPASDTAKDVDIAEELNAIAETQSFRDMLFDCLDGFGKGFACVETMWDTSAAQWKPSWRYRSPTYFQLATYDDQEIRMRDLSNPVDGVELHPWKWVVHVPKRISAHPLIAGLSYPISVFHLFKSVGIRDWVIYAEIFGMPVRVGKYGSSASEADKASLRSAVAQLGADASVVMHESMSIEFQGVAGGAGSEVHENLARYLDEQITKGVVGQTMTSDNGSSLSQAEVHERILERYGKSDAQRLVATVMRDIATPYVELNHGPNVPVPKFYMLPPVKWDPKAFTEAVLPLVDRGLEVPVRYVQDVVSTPSRDGDEPILRAVTAPSEPPAAPGDEPNRLEPNARTGSDAIVEDLVESLTAEWERVLSSEQIAMSRLEAAYKRGGKDAVAEEMTALQRDGVIDGAKLLETLAVSQFISRGVGDTRD